MIFTYWIFIAMEYLICLLLSISIILPNRKFQNLDEINELNPNTCGCDGISTYIIRLCISFLFPEVTDIFNFLISASVSYARWKSFSRTKFLICMCFLKKIMEPYNYMRDSWIHQWLKLKFYLIKNYFLLSRKNSKYNISLLNRIFKTTTMRNLEKFFQII